MRNSTGWASTAVMLDIVGEVRLPGSEIRSVMVSDVEGQLFRISGENVSRFQADTRPSGYARCLSVSVTVNEGRSHRSNHITPTTFLRSPMIGSANARCHGEHSDF
jgi:hypothetical protein